MSKQIEITAELRKDVGKGASRRLRRLADRVPGIIYGASQEAQPLTLNANQLGKAMQEEAFYSQILSVMVEGSLQQAVVRDVQRHPSHSRLLHIDFMRVSADRELEVEVPIHFINEESCVGVRQQGGVLAHNLMEVEISCLPRHLPEFIEIDVAELALGDAIHLSDVKVPEGVTIVALTHGEDHDLPVVSCNAPRVSGDDDAADQALDAPAEAGTDAAGEAPANE
jgi:large subunit ribosomal protein L25